MVQEPITEVPAQTPVQRGAGILEQVGVEDDAVLLLAVVSVAQSNMTMHSDSIEANSMQHA